MEGKVLDEARAYRHCQASRITRACCPCLPALTSTLSGLAVAMQACGQAGGACCLSLSAANSVKHINNKPNWRYYHGFWRRSLPSLTRSGSHSILELKELIDTYCKSSAFLPLPLPPLPLPALPAAEEKTEFDVVLAEVGATRCRSSRPSRRSPAWA